MKFCLYTILLAMGITCSADDFSTLYASSQEIGAGSSGDGSDSAAVEPICQGTINQPTLNYCVSVYGGKPVLQVFSEVVSNLSTPLTFSLSYRDEIPSIYDKTEVPPVIMNATCSHHNCTALFLIDPVRESYASLAVNVTVSTDGCSNSTVKVASGRTRFNEVVNTTLGEAMETRATIVCQLPCFSEDLGCLLAYLGQIVNETINSVNPPTFHTSIITGNSHNYSYPSQNITITNLTSNSKYLYCVHALNLNTMNIPGLLSCGNFTTKNFTAKHYHHHNKGSEVLIAIIATTISILVVLLIIVLIIYCCFYKTNQALEGMTVAAQLASVVASRTGFFVQMTQAAGDEPEIESNDLEDYLYIAPSDDISLRSAEHTDSV